MTAVAAPENVPGIRDLKRRYKLNLAQGRALPAYDQAIPLPLSTGNPLYDAALTDKLVATGTMSEAEHLNRGWQMVRGASPEEMRTLASAARGLLNDYKLLLALKAWQEGDDYLTRCFLRALPWGWRLAFPTACIKPAAHIFTGWRRSVRFRLIEEPRFGALHELYREILAEATPVALLKYRSTVHQATALLHYRFEGERERAIHDWCYDSGNVAALTPELEPIGLYVRARQALRAEGVGAFLDVLNAAEDVIPITSYMGLLGGNDIKLTDTAQYGVPALRDYAVRCTTAVESLLRLTEWGSWMTPTHAETLSAKVKTGVIDAGLDIPFFKVTRAFLAAPQNVRKMVLSPLYLPLLEHFGRQTAALLPPPGPLTFMQPGNMLHRMSFLLYATLSSAVPTRLILLYKRGVEEVAPLSLAEVGEHLADSEQELQRWLLSQFGGLTIENDYTYDYGAVGKVLRGLDPQAPLLLDLPFASSMDLLEALLPFERAFNLNNTYGAPGELCVAYEYYADFFIGTRKWNAGSWSRYSDSAAQKFAEVLERLRLFQQLAVSQEGGGAQ